MNTIRRPPSPHRVPPHRSLGSSAAEAAPLHSPTPPPSPPSFQIQGLGGPPQACFNLGCPRAAFTQRSALKPESLRGCLGPRKGGEALPRAWEEGWVGWGRAGVRRGGAAGLIVTAAAIAIGSRGSPAHAAGTTRWAWGRGIQQSLLFQTPCPTSPGVGDGQGRPGVLQPMGFAKSRTRLSA